MTKEEIRAAAERLGDIATNCNHVSQHWDTFLVACAPCIRRVAEREITALVEKARDEALEEAARMLENTYNEAALAKRIRALRTAKEKA